MPTPKESIFVEFQNGTNKPYSVSDFEKKKAQIFKENPTASAYRISDYDGTDEDISDNDKFIISSAEDDPFEVDAKAFREKKDALYGLGLRGLKVQRVRPVDYFGEQGDEQKAIVNDRLDAIRAAEEAVHAEAREKYKEYDNRPRTFVERFNKIFGAESDVTSHLADRGQDKDTYEGWLKTTGRTDYGNSIMDYQAAEQLLKEAQVMQNAVTKNDVDAADSKISAWIKGNIQGQKKYVNDKETWDQVVGFENAAAMYSLQKKIQKIFEGLPENADGAAIEKAIKNGLTQSEQALFDAVQTSGAVNAALQDKISGSVKAGEIMAASERMGLEFLMLNGISGAANRAVKRNVSKYLYKRMRSVAMKPLKRKIVKGVSKVIGEEAGALVGGAIQTALGPSNWSQVAKSSEGAMQAFMSSPAQFMNAETRAQYGIEGPQQMGEMLWDGALDMLFENATEFGLGPFNKIFGAAGRAGYRGLKKLGWNKIATLLSPAASQFLNKMGIHGLAEETGEEVNGAIIDYLRGNKDAIKDFVDLENMGVLMASFVPTIGLGAGFSAAQRGVYNHKYNKAVNAYVDYLMETRKDRSGKSISREEAEKIAKSVDGQTPEELGHKAAVLLDALDKSGISVNGKDTEARLILDLLKTARDKNAANGANELVLEEERENQREAILKNTKGRDFWRERPATQTDEAGEEYQGEEEYVDYLTTNGSNNLFITDEDADGNITTVDENGRVQQFTADEVKENLENGTFGSRRQMSLGEYLDERNGKRKDAQWEVSQERVGTMGAYQSALQIGTDLTHDDAYMTRVTLDQAAEEALSAGMDEALIDATPEEIARVAWDERQAGNVELAEAISNFAEAKAAEEGLREGYMETARQQITVATDASLQGADRNGKITVAYMGNTPVYVLSNDVAIDRNRRVNVLGGGPKSLVQVRLTDGNVLQVQADQLSGASVEDAEDWRSWLIDSGMYTVEDTFNELSNTISPAGMFQETAKYLNKAVLVQNKSGEVQSVIVMSLDPNTGLVTLKDGDNIFAVPVDEFYNMAQKDASENLVLDSTAPENTESESAPVSAPVTPGSPTPGPVPAGGEATAPSSAEDLIGSEVNIEYHGSKNVFVEDVSGGKVRFSYETENGKIVNGELPVAAFMKAIRNDSNDSGEGPGAGGAGAGAVDYDRVKEMMREDIANGLSDDDILTKYPGSPAKLQELLAELHAEESGEAPEAGTETGIPFGKDGEPIYDAPGVTPEMAYDDIYSKLSGKNADAFVVEQAKAAVKNLEKARKSVAEGDAEKAAIDDWDKKPGEGIQAFLNRQNEAKAKVDERTAKAKEDLPELERKVAFWRELVVVAQDNIKAREAEAERQKLIDKYGVDTSKFDLTPQTAEEAVAEYLGNGVGLIDLDDAKKETFGKSGRIPSELFRHVGNGGILTKEGGRTIADVANDIVGEYESTLGLEQDEVRDIIIDFLTRYTKTEMRNLIFNNRLDAAIAEKEEMENIPEEVAAEEEPIPAEEAVEEAPEGTEVPEAEVPESEPAEPEAPAAEEDLPEGASEEEPQPAEPQPTGGSVQSGAETAPGKEAGPSNSPGNSVHSQRGGTTGVPATAADIKTKEQARAYFEGLYGKGTRANNSVRVWELTHKKPSQKKEDDGAISKMALNIYDDTGLTAEEAAELVTLGTQLAEDFIAEDGLVKFPQFFKRLVETFGDGIRPFSPQLYLGAQANVPDDILAQMDDVVTVRGFDRNTDINDISDEQSDTDIQPENGSGSEAVGDDTEGGSEETSDGQPDTGTPEGDGGSGRTGVGVLDGGNDSESDTGADGPRADGTPGRGRRSGSNGGGTTSQGSGRNRGGRQANPGRAEGAGRNSGRVEESEEEKEAKAKAEEQAAYEAEKERIKDETDTKKLKSLLEDLKKKISDISDKWDAVKAKLNGQLRAVRERLQELFSNNANKSEALAQEKIPYAPVSDATGEHSIGSVVPSGAADYMRDAVKRVEAEVGKPIAEYVKDELGYASLDDMFTSDGKDIGLSAEQVDAVGLAIHQMKTGRIFIVGDMTGVGKGRVGAALIRWGKRNNKKVIFCTEQPNLFTAMYGDLSDIGSDGLVPFIMNDKAEANITDEDGNVIVRHPSENEYQELYKSGKDELPVVARGANKGRQYDFVMTTYSQLQASESEEEGDSEKVKKKNERNKKGRGRIGWLKSYAKDAIIIMDESHTAAGEGSTRGENARKLVEVAQGVTFMSATFAKTPESMGIYAIRSSMNDAMITREQLIQAISKWGIPMQEILAASLFKTGEMVRRERDFEGVKTHWMSPEDNYTKEEIATTQRLSDKTVGVINAIIDFQRRYVDPVIRKLNEETKRKNEAALASGADDIHVSEYASTPYSGQVSNVIGMMLFALKAKKAAEVAIEQIKRGEKPVIAVDNTLGAYVDQIEGSIDSADFGAVLMKGLAFALKYQLSTEHLKLTELPNGTRVYKKVPGDRKVEKFESIESLLPEGALDAIKELGEKISAYGKETLAMDLPLSPIDYIKKKLADAGYRCGEITKRENELVQNADGTWSKRKIKHDKKDVIKRFNGGSAKNPLPKEETYDAVIMNRSGATGNSMHASRRFGDQRPRKMIILQAAKDPNNEVQIRGRIDRTGQVSRGEYFYIISPIPAEKKITMMLKQKLASLDANSVGSEKVASNKVDAEDMDNKYGDEVARDFLVDHEEIHLQMDPSKQMKRDRKTGEFKGRPGLLYDLLLSMQRMTCAEQEMILSELEESYAQKIEYLNQNGINDLATTTMNLEATTIDSAIMVKGRDNDALSEFAHDTTIERVEVNVLRKPMRSEELHKKSKELGAEEKHTTVNSHGEIEDLSYGEFIQQKARDGAEQMKAEKKKKQEEAEQKLAEDLRAQNPQMEGETDERYASRIENDPKMQGLRLRNANEYARFTSQLDEQLRFAATATRYFVPGHPYLVPLNESEDAQNMYGRFIGFKIGKDGRPKSLEAVFATKDSRAQVSIPVVNMHGIIERIRSNSGGMYDIFGKTRYDYASEEAQMKSYDEWWDKMIPKNTSRGIRYMITGNIIQAAGSLFSYRGTIVTFTRKNAETGEVTVDKGLLLAEDFDPENFMVRTSVTKDDVWNNAGEFSDELTNIAVYRDGDKLIVKFVKPRGSRAKLSNHPIMEDEDFKALCENGTIEPYSENELRAVVSEKNAEAALEYLYKNYGFTQGHLLVLPDSTDKPDRIEYTGKPYQEVIDTLKPKYRVYSSDSAQDKIDEALKTYRMDITDEELKKKIRELVQLRQAYIRRDNCNRDNPDLAWRVIIYEQQIEKLERPQPGETTEDALGRKKNREELRNKMEAFKEELASRGFEKGHLKHFKQGQTDIDTIEKTFNEFNTDKENERLAKIVLGIVKKLPNLHIFFNETTENDTGGYTAGDLLAYNWRFMNEDWIPDQLKANTILHEMVHTATAYAMNAIQRGSDHLIPGLVEAANQAEALFQAIRNNPAFRHQVGEDKWYSYTDYGVAKNSKELLAEAGSNQSFRDDLAKVKVLVSQSTSFGQTVFTFQDVTDKAEAGGRVISALDAAMDILQRLLQGFNADAYRKMWAGTGYGEISYNTLSREAGTPQERAVNEAELKATNATLDRMSDELGIKINRVSRDEMPKGHKSDKGYYNPNTGEMTICMDNVTDERDAIATVLHESVGHHGLRKLLGDGFNDAMVRIYAALDAEGRRWVNSYIARHPNADNVRAVEEYLSHIAERGDFKNVVWQRIKEIIGKIVDALFGTHGFLLTDNELNYILRASYENLKNPNWLNTAEGKAFDTLLKRRLGINETDPRRPTDPQGPGAGNLYRDGDTGVASEDYNRDAENKWNEFVRQNQNADLPVKNGMDRVAKETGKVDKDGKPIIEEDEDYLTRHNLSSSRAESEAHNFELFQFSPMMDQVRAIQSKILGERKGTKEEREEAYQRILDYLYAVSGLERNNYKNQEIEDAKKAAVEKAKAEGASAEDIAEIEKKYDEMKKDWSGLTSLVGRPKEEWVAAENDARKLIADFQKLVGDNKALDELWKRIRSCTDFSLDHAFKYGLLTREEYEKLRGTATTPRMWEYYLPLRGFNENTAEDVFSYANFTAPSTNSVVTRKMKGRWTEADNPLANILNIAETEIVQGNDNWAKQALYRFVLNAGENSLLSVREPWYEKNPATGKWSLAEPKPKESIDDFEAKMEAARAKGDARQGRRGLRLDKIMANKAHRNEHLIRLKVGGMDKMIWVNGNPALAKAASGIGRAQNLKLLRRASRVLSNLFTTYSLDFTAKNLIRDTIYSRVALHVKEDEEYRYQFRKNWWKNFGYGAFAFPMIRLAAMWENGELQEKAEAEKNGEVDKHGKKIKLTKRERQFIDFMTDGGQTGYTIINSVRQIKSDIEKSMRRAGGKPGTIPILGHYAKAVKTLNEAFELLTRFTAYQTSKDMGRSGQRSASDAKEISVNFNRRGAQDGEGVWGNIAAYLGASHYFYNAGVQGFDNFLHLFKVKSVKMSVITAGFILTGILTPMINSMLAAAVGGDDDDWYWNLPEWVRRNNIILGTGSWYIAIPLPVEFRAPNGVGDIIASAFVYDKTANRTFGGVSGDLIATASGILPVNPIEGYNSSGNLGDAIIRAVAPDAGMFFVDWATNRDYTGRPLWKENPFSDNKPKSQGAYASTPRGIVLTCQKLAEVSNGYVDIAPGIIRDFMNNYGGGFFRAAEDASKIFTGIFAEDPDRPFRWDNVPFFSGFSGHIDEDRSNTFASNALYEYKNMSESIVRRMNAVCGTDELTAAMVYGSEPLPEQYASKVRAQRILSGRDYVMGKMYRDGMNNEYVMKRNKKTGKLYKSKEVKRYGVNALKKQWQELREQWTEMPDGTPEERDAKKAFSLEVQEAWHRYYDAQADLAQQLLDYEYGKTKE